MTENTTPKFTIGAVTELPMYEGQKNRNSFSIEVTMDSVVHEAHVRRESSAIKLPAALKDHPLASEIKTAAGQALIDKLRPGLVAAREKRRRFAKPL